MGKLSEYLERAIVFFTDKGVSRGLAIAYIAVSAVLVVMALVALVMRIIVVIKYYDGNRMNTKSGKNCMEVARDALDKEGLKNVKVKKANIIRAFVFGNSYSLSQKTIFLRGSIANKSSITAVGMAMQKVGVAKLINGGNKTAITRNRAQVWSLVGPILFIPIILCGAVIDYVLFHVFGTFSIVALVIGGIILLSGFVATLLNLPVEKKANDMALEMIKKDHLLDDEEIRAVEKVFQAYIIAYICEFIVAVLRIVQIVLEVVMNVQINSNKK